MTLSRRSFLKVAGLTAVSVAGASLFTGCTVLPAVEITLVDKNGTLGWDGNKKVVASTKLPWFIVKDSVSEDDAKKAVASLVKDKKFTISNAVDGKIPVNKADEKKYTVTIEFETAKE